jgi:hypothetical protein
MTTRGRTSLHRTRRNLLLDTVLLTACLLVLSPRLTGMTIHEWLSASLGLAILIHLLWHWEWIVAVLRRMFSRMAASARLSLVLNLVLFIAFTVSLFTGLMISRVLLPALGLEAQRGGTWRILHTQSSDLVLILLGLHLALHWKWIFRNMRTFIRIPRSAEAQGLSTPAPAVVPVTVRDDVQR